jgi:hypothetical protein
MTATLHIDDTHRAARLLADAWGPALERSWHLGYEVGWANGYTRADADMASAWHTMYLSTRATLESTMLIELERRREPDWRPCPARCGACSRCIASLAYWRRGGREFLGIAREARLARTAS